MSGMAPDRTLPWDWYPGTIPENVTLSPSAYVETSYSFVLCRSRRPDAVTIADGASTYLGTMFDLGPAGRVALGHHALVHGARIVCDAEVTIEPYALVSWNVVLMDSYRVPRDPAARRALVRRVPESQPRRLPDGEGGRPIRIGQAAWIGFDACVLPGVTVGEGAVVGARSVVAADVEPFTIVAGNPARLIRRLTAEEMADGR
jgi:carbonic anhydrase/acetyltransferase-like protein (isoleucine patch superfamily)